MIIWDCRPLTNGGRSEVHFPHSHVPTALVFVRFTFLLLSCQGSALDFVLAFGGSSASACGARGFSAGRTLGAGSGSALPLSSAAHAHAHAHTGAPSARDTAPVVASCCSCSGS